MTHPAPAVLAGPTATLRRAVDADIPAIAAIWHRGWREVHLDHVPATLRRHRRHGDFRDRVPACLDLTTIATIGSDVVGFVMAHDDEIEQLYVAATARGSGVAAALLGHGETVVGARFDRAWLAVVAGNVRARRFYERNGWSDRGAFDNPAWTTSGPTIAVPSRRYEKRLTRTRVRSAEPEAARIHRHPAGGPADTTGY